MLKLFRFILFVYVGKVSPVKQMKKHMEYIHALTVLLERRLAILPTCIFCSCTNVPKNNADENLDQADHFNN